MIVAHIELTASNGFAGHGFVHIVHYDDVEAAWKAYCEVAGLIERRSARKNDLPVVVEFAGVNRLSIPLDEIRSIGIHDYAKQNEQKRGLRDAFPHLKL